MRHWLIAPLLAAAMLTGSGCAGVLLNAEYSRLLDETTVLAEETARRAEAGRLDAAAMRRALRSEADVWQKFRDARDGRDSSGMGRRR